MANRTSGFKKARARDGRNSPDICRHYTTRVVKAVEHELEKVFNQASLYHRSADTLWSSARIGDVGKTKRGYVSVTPDGEGGGCDCHDIGRPDAVLAQETKRGCREQGGSSR